MTQFEQIKMMKMMMISSFRWTRTMTDNILNHVASGRWSDSTDCRPRDSISSNRIRVF